MLCCMLIFLLLSAQRCAPSELDQKGMITALSCPLKRHIGGPLLHKLTEAIEFMSSLSHSAAMC